MSLTELARSEVPAASSQRPGHGSGALTAGLRALFAAVSGLLLTSGISVVLWAITPSSNAGPQQSLRAGVAAFAAGNAMTLSIGRAALTLPPLMITIVAVALLAGISGRGRTGTEDRTGEVTRTGAAAAVYAAVVTVAGVALGTPGAVAGEQWWRPFLLAAVVVGTTVFFRGEAWRALVLARTPRWVPVGVRLGVVGTAGVLAAGAAAVVVGLAGSFGDASTVQTLAAPGPAAGFGMALLGIAYLPNAVLAGAGYVTGVGFHIGAGSYSPFGSSPVELPAVSLLAAAPDGREASRVGMVLLLVPVVVALLIGRAAIRRLDSRQERLSAVGTAAAMAGLSVAVLAALAGGGITGGQWASIGAPPLRLGIVTALIVGIFGAAAAALARQSAVSTSGMAGGDPGAVEPDDAVDAVDDSAAELDDAEDPAAELDAAADHNQVTEAVEAGGGSGAVPQSDDPEIDTDVEATRTAATDAGTDSTDSAHAGTDSTDAGSGDIRSDADDDLAAAAEFDAGTARKDVETEPGTAAAAGRGPVQTDGGPVQTSGTTVPAGGDTVPLARREDDVLAASALSSDADVPERLRSHAEPRHVG